ncbi:dmX-like protein 2 isoform X2 [Rhopalosiphum padi]|uniref:dmX-like protein 2 isoform X2 n=1 Tax=Rhopalosiphum padi TaxID=40932 RepID=UPI00298E4D4B|nr:dmX-like protein 2 isoform X2 [Rhopalosiphum padi]
MNCHQILSGACNAGDRCFAVGSVEGVPFTAYAAGCNIVILASTFERVQIIPGAIHNYIRISCLDCSTDTGKIAAAYDNQICVFEPTPLVCKNSPHQLDYKWVETASWRTACRISCLSWNLEGTRLLTGGTVLQLWHQQLPDEPLEENTGMTSDGVTFEIGEEAIPMSTTTSCNCEVRGWECVWQKETATPVVHIAFSPDGTLFATAGKDDRLVKIWFENKQLLFPSKSVDQNYSMSAISNFGEPNYGFVYIAHPRAVTQLSWRKTSKYMPKGSVSNMLVTSCRDNICRLWSETVLPDDGLVNMSHFDPLAAHNPRFRTHRHKHRLLQRLKHMKACFHIRRHAKHQGDLGTGMAGSTSSTIPTLPSTFSVHDFHSYGFHGTGIIPGLHFHLAASINAETDIPLVPSLSSTDPEREPNFVLHWLNNKEMHFSLQAEAILNELTKKVVEKDDMLINEQFIISEHHDVEYSDSRRKQNKLGKSTSQDESVSDEHSCPSTHPTLSNTTSVNSFTTDTNHITTDSLDNKIECLLRDWHHSPDLLFAVHPIDGSYLIWVVDWLDEYHPGSFRQAQVSFSTRIPNAFPLGDATTMSHNVCLYHTSGSSLQLAFRDVVKTAAAAPSRSPSDVHGINGDYGDSSLPRVLEEDGDSLAGDIDLHHQNESVEPSSLTENGKPNRANSTMGEDSGTFNDIISAPPCPTLSMVTKHTNGTLNLWQLTFADKSKFSQVLSIGHASRASGHRFRVNDVTCHPVLPLLLTTSHHNLPDQETPASPLSPNPPPIAQPPSGFCSELILWRVDAVGPLSKSGGVSELARINSLQISAFSNVAWIPTLLPSTTLGTLSNSPSACFVASDGECLRVYQAVIDARTLLAEVSSSEHRSRMAADSMVSLSTDVSSENDLKHNSLHDRIKIVSQQSTARPGCIIQLDAISDATHDWQNTQFLHVFQEQLMTGERASGRGLVDAISGLDSEEPDDDFEEPFYLVVLERTVQGTTVHMWRLIIASQPENNPLSESMMYVPDSQLVQDDDDMDNSGKLGATNLGGEETTQPTLSAFAPHVSISTIKICTQELNLPDGVDVIHASPAGGHLSSASIYPACFAPYVFVTACSDSTLRFWKCKITKTADEVSYQWVEWEMIRKDRKSMIEISGQPLNISAAYSGRIACAYKYGKSFTRPSKKDPESRYVNLCVAIYECESTGGSEWLLEDTIHMKNIHLPKLHIDPSVDLTYLHDQTILSSKKHKLQSTVLKALSSEDLDGTTGRCNGRNGENETNLVKSSHGLLAVPSFSTLQSLRKSIIENGNTCPLTQKHIVQLDWVSKEDGSHILTVAVGSKIMLFTPVSSDLAQANMKAMKESQSVNRPILRKASSLVSPNFVDEIRWMKLRKIDLTTADGLPPLPMQISWVRDGILVVGMDSEMHVYSQWKPNTYMIQKNALLCCKLIHQESDELQDTRNLRDEDLRTLAHETSQRRLANVSSMPHLSRVSSINLNMLTAETKKKKLGIQNGDSSNNIQDSYMPDYGLFEASRIACPVLPQYHPKQLMELLNSGKIRWVKAILAHLVRCISTTCSVRQGAVVCSYSEEDNLTRQRGWSRSRTLSVSYAGAATSPMEPRGSTTAIPEELMLDYAEITSIPPLPLWTLLAADKENASTALKLAEDEKDYNELFNGNISTSEDNLDDILNDESEPESPRRCERQSNATEKQQCLLSHFGPKQGQLLSRLLTHTHLPGLSSLDQMHLLALADTVSTCNTDFADRFVDKTQFAKDSSAPHEGEVCSDSLDDCGLRFLLAMKHYNYLLRCLGVAQRTQFQKRGMCSADIAWAFHSESEEELLQLTPSYVRGTPRWSALKELGVGWWLRNQTLLRTCIEKIAKAAYQTNQDPLDAAIFYLAMKKKSLVWGLFRSKRDERMTQFFSNNFAEDRWRKAALKNAFALLGKQRFEHAAAFFLLAGALRDAIEVCLNKLDDLQLAMVIARLYEGEIDSTPPSLKRLLYEEILGCDQNGENQKLSMANPDPFLRSMALWILKDSTGSLNTLVQMNVGTMHPQYNDEEKQETSAANPNVFNFYVYLRTHPLLIRHYLASTYQDKKNHTVVLAGFSYGSDARCRETSDRQLMLEDSISPLERQLYFKTAHAHFKAGCPALALEVLSKLPSKIMDPSTEQSNSLVSTPTRSRDIRIDTGILMHYDVEQKPAEAVNLDVVVNHTVSAEQIDWSTPVVKPKDELVLDWSDNEEDDDDDDEITVEEPKKIVKQESMESEKSKSDSKACNLDVMAQQLKFVACLKILMEELSTLATGYEVDGGELRYHLYLWLEREVDALRHLCNYSSKDSMIIQYEGGLETSILDNREFTSTPTLKNSVDKPTLHDILLAEKIDFEAKVQRAARRKKWLKENETLLRTLLSYCSLHGAGGGGLASVRMELVLLLQELQQEKTQQQLLSPLPFPTTLPLLSASVACNKTVIADPVRYLQAQAHDMLQTVIDIRCPPLLTRMDLSYLFVLRDLSVALSACFYQSLCDSDTIAESYQSGADNPTYCSHLIAAKNRKRRYSIDEPIKVTTPPSKWPGVSSLRALLAHDKDEDAPKLNTLLCEAFVATYMGLLVYAFATCDCHILYRLVGQTFSENTWSTLFGGGVKKLLKVAPTAPKSRPNSLERENSASSDIGVWTAVTSLTKQKVRLNMKLLGQFVGSPGTPTIKEDKPTYREHFVPPEMSMISYFLNKPNLATEVQDVDYDSADSAVSDLSEDEDEECDIFDNTQDNKSKTGKTENTEHSNPYSYAWMVMRLAIMQLVQEQLHAFLTVAAIDLQELPVSSPLIHGTLRAVSQWQEILKEELESKGPPPVDYIPGCFVEQATTGPPINKYRTLLDKSNTPFHPRHGSAAPARRLWNFLVRQEFVQDLFIRSIFSRQPRAAGSSTLPTMNQEVKSCSGSETPNPHLPDPVRIIHKEQDSISAFCLNLANSSLLALATPREIQEMDISLLLESPSWLEDECEFDLVNLSRDHEHQPSSFLVIQTSIDRPLQTSPGTIIVNPLPTSPSVTGLAGQTGRGASVMKGLNFPGCHDPRFCQFVCDRSRLLLRPVMKHRVDNIRRICPHPLLPVYLTGSQDGSVHIWEWGHPQTVAEPRAAGTFAKVTRVRFSQHGNKFGVADGDGNLSLFNVGLTSSNYRPFYTFQCHNKVTSDFVFLGSCSLIATTGHSSENRNVALWDTLLPHKKSLVTAFVCHEQGSTCIGFAPQHQVIVTGGRKGDICIFDVRGGSGSIKHRYLGHDSCLKCMTIDPHEQFYCTGAADGDIKIWNLSTHQLMYTFPAEHARSSFFKHIGQGVTQLQVDSSARLFSCGADGSMKVRQLPDRYH